VIRDLGEFRVLWLDVDGWIWAGLLFFKNNLGGAHDRAHDTPRTVAARIEERGHDTYMAYQCSS